MTAGWRPPVQKNWPSGYQVAAVCNIQPAEVRTWKGLTDGQLIARHRFHCCACDIPFLQG